MSLILNRISHRFSEFMGFDRMGEAFSIYTRAYVFVWIYSTLETVFINTLLIRLTGDSNSVMHYKMIVYLVTALGMHGSAVVSHLLSPVHSTRIASVLYGLMYLAFFSFTGYIGVYMPLLGILSGVACGFYWCAHSTLATLYTTESNRDTGMGILGVINGVISLVLPVISGLIISSYPVNYLGYRIMFGLGLAMVICQFVLTFRLRPVEHKTKKPQFGLALSLARKRKTVWFMFLSEFVRGFRDGTFLFFLNTILFETVNNEGLVGLNTFFTGGASILAAWVYGRFVEPHARGKYAAISTTILLGLTLVLGIRMNSVTIIIFSVFNSFFQLFIVNASAVSCYGVVTQDDTARFCIGESFAFKEVALGVGRVLGILLVMQFPKTRLGYIVAMLILTASQYFVAFAVRVIRRELDKLQEADTAAQVRAQPLQTVISGENGES